MSRSALVLLVPEAEPLVGQLRLAHDPAARAGVPAHVTMLFPFAPPDALDEPVRARLAAHFAAEDALELSFDRVARFPEVTYLALADAAPVVARIRVLASAWPAYPLYEGKYADVVPHLTVGHGGDDLFGVASAELGPRLPLRAQITRASLLVEDAAGRWRLDRHFAFR